MKKIFLAVFLLVSSPFLWAQAGNCDVSSQAPVKLLAAELKRGFKTFKKQKPPVYYLSYTFTETREQVLSVSEGGVKTDRSAQEGVLEVTARAGSPKMDNTRLLKGGADNYSASAVLAPEIAGDGQAFKTAVWRLTQSAVERAQEDFSRVQTDSLTASKRSDESDDFVFPPKSSYCRTGEPLSFDTARIKALLLKASRLTEGKAFILASSFDFSLEEGHRYFVDSVGTRLKTPFAFVRLGYGLSGKNADGLEIARAEYYDVLKESELPSEEAFLAAVNKSIAELEILSKAPEAEPMTAPAILKNRAMAVFVHEVLGHRVEGHRQKDDSFGKTFTDKVGQPVVSPILSIVDDATLPYFNGVPLRGFYEYDDEGVKARPVPIIEDGVLKNFLMSSSPVKGFSASNGHGRRQAGRRPVARMGNTRVIASETVPYDQLEQMLLAEIKRQGKPYGFIIEDLSGGFTQTSTYTPQAFKLQPTFVYRLYPDGRKEAVRGADMVGTPLVSFNKVLAAADDYAVFNGSCGAESGWVPVSGIAPSVLLESLEIEKTNKSSYKPPVLPPPSAAAKGGKK